MNGLPLVVLGVMFFTLAYSLLKVQGKIGDITKAVDQGFKTIQDAINKNLVDETGPMGSVANAVNGNLTAIKDSMEKIVLGPDGVRVKMNATLSTMEGITDKVAAEIKGSRDFLTGTVAPIVGETQTIFDDIGKPLNDASTTIFNIGKWINVDILGEHPLVKLAQPFYDVSTTVGDTGKLCVTVSEKIGLIGGDITSVADSLSSVRAQVVDLSIQTGSMRTYLDGILVDGAAKLGGEIDTIKKSVDGVISSFKDGGKSSLKEIADAQAFLDTTLGKLINRQWISALAVAGVALILAGVSIGI